MEQCIEALPADKRSVLPLERAGKYLTFTLSNQEYGVGIRKVREIMGILPITSIPHVPEHVKGVINLRGKVIPIIDLRLKFGISPMDKTNQQCIVVVEIKSHDKEIMVGTLVDSVSEVINIRETDIEDTPTCGIDVHTDFILGMAKTGQGIKILLDIDMILGQEEMITVSESAVN
jgi:purine-binding chemotaxis protein CheW